MNEEIVFGMGLNPEGFGKGMRQGKAEAESMKGAMKDLGGVISGVFAGLSIAALANAGRAILEFSKHIATMADDVGVSTTFLQQWNYAARKSGADAETAEKGIGKLAVKIGEARMGNVEAAAAFDKWGISMNNADGSARSVEEVTEAVSKRIQEIDDPTKRAAMAFELFGKSGVKLVETLRDLDELKAKSSGKILDDGDIARLDSAERTIAGWGGKLKVAGGKLLGAALTVFGISDPNAAINRKLEELDSKGVEQPKADVTATKEYAEAMRKLMQARAESGGTNAASKLVALMREEKVIAEQLDATGVGAIDNINLQTELQKKHNEVLDQRKKIADDYNKSQKEAADKAKQEQERELTAQKEIHNATLNIAKENRSLDEAKNSRSQYSLDDLTSSKFRFGGQLGEDQQNAFQIKRLEQQGNWNKAHGFVDDAKARFDSADALRKNLSSNVLAADKNPYRSMEESLQDSKDSLQEIVKMATMKGLKVMVESITLAD